VDVASEKKLATCDTHREPFVKVFVFSLGLSVAPQSDV
jgi:hypothetical protein